MNLFSIFRRSRPATPPIYLHAGPWKTGTTAIQHILLSAQHLIHYPDPEQSGPGHANVVRRLQQLKDPAEGYALLQQMVMKARKADPSKPIVFSSENFSLLRKQKTAVEALQRFTLANPTELIITYRPPLEKIYSLIQERVKNGLLFDLDGDRIVWDFAMKNQYKGSDFFDAMIDIGKFSKVHVVMVDVRQPNFLVDSFSKIIGVELPLELAPENGNLKMPFRKMLMLADQCRKHPDWPLHVHLKTCSEKFEELVKEDPSVAEEPYPPIPPEVEQAMQERTRIQGEYLRTLEKARKVVVYRPV